MSLSKSTHERLVKALDDPAAADEIASILNDAKTFLAKQKVRGGGSDESDDEPEAKAAPKRKPH